MTSKLNKLDFSPDKLTSEIEEIMVSDIFNFTQIEGKIINLQPGSTLIDKLINIYKSTKKDTVIQDIKAKIDSSLGTSGQTTLKKLEEIKSNLKQIEKSLRKLKTYIDSGNIKEAMDFVKNDIYLHKYLEFYGIDYRKILSGEKQNIGMNAPETVQFVNDLADIFKKQAEIKKLRDTIESQNFEKIVNIFANSINLGLLDQLSFNEVETLSRLIENISKIDSQKLANILSKPVKDLSLEDIDFLSKVDISSLVQFLQLLGMNGIVSLKKDKIEKLKQILLIVVKMKYSSEVVMDSTSVAKKEKGSLINREEELSTFVDDIKALSMLSLDKKEFLEKLNADIALKGVLLKLIDFQNQAKSYPGGAQKLFNDIKNALVDYVNNHKDWLASLDESVQDELRFILNILQTSSNYKEFVENLEFAKRKVKRAENLILLLDVYSKGMLGKGISSEDYNKMIKTILSGDFVDFLELYKKLYSQIQSDAEGIVERDGYELAKIFGDDSHIDLSLRKYLGFDFSKVKNLFNEKGYNFLDGVNYGLYDKLKKLIENMENEDGAKEVKENLRKFDIPTLLVKLYEENNRQYKLVSTKEGVAYEGNYTKLIINKNGEISFEPKNNTPSYMNDSFSEKNNKLTFKEKSIDVDNFGIPKGFYKRLKDIYPNLIPSTDNIQKQKQLVEQFKHQFLTTYKIIKYIKETTKGVVPISLIEQFGTYSYLLFGDTNYDLLGTNPKLSFVKKEIDKINLNDFILNEKDKEKIGKIVEKQWESMPLYQRQILYKKINGTGCGNNCDGLSPKIKTTLINKTLKKLLLTKKAELEYILLNADDTGITSSLKENFEITLQDKVFAFIDSLFEELLPVVIAEIVGTVLDLTGIFAEGGVAMQIWGASRFAVFVGRGLNYTFRYGMVEPTVYTLTSNYIHGDSLMAHRGNNAMYYLVLPAFGKIGGYAGRLFTGKGTGEISKLSSAFWIGGSSILGLEATKYVIDGKIDISQIPNDVLFMILLHGTSKSIEGLREFVKVKTGVDIKGLVWNSESKSKLVEWLGKGKEIPSKLSGKVKKVGTKPIYAIKSMKADISFYGSVKDKKLLGKLEDNTFVLKDKDGKIYSYKKENDKGKIIWKKEELVLNGKEINNLQSITFNKGNILVGSTKDGKFILMELNGNKLVEKKVFDPTNISDFEKFAKTLEDLNVFSEPKVVSKLLSDKGFSEADLKKMEEILQKAKFDPAYKEKILKELNSIEKMSDDEIREIGIFKKTKAVIKDKLIKKGKKPEEADKEADKEALSIVRKSVGKAISILKIPLKVTGFFIQTLALITLIVGGGLFFDYYSDHKLDSLEFLKKHFGVIGGGTAGYWLGKKITGDSFIGKIVAAIALGFIGKELQEKGYEGLKKDVVGFLNEVKNRF